LDVEDERSKKETNKNTPIQIQKMSQEIIGTL
jgi:hypothetical protein